MSTYGIVSQAKANPNWQLIWSGGPTLCPRASPSVRVSKGTGPKRLSCGNVPCCNSANYCTVTFNVVVCWEVEFPVTVMVYAPAGVWVAPIVPLFPPPQAT